MSRTSPSTRESASPAGEPYVSPLFRGLRRYAISYADASYILSAKHGLLRPEEVIEPYDIALQQMGKGKWALWAKRVQM